MTDWSGSRYTACYVRSTGTDLRARTRNIGRRRCIRRLLGVSSGVRLPIPLLVLPAHPFLDLLRCLCRVPDVGWNKELFFSDVL